MRAIALLGCEEAMRAIASSMSPHVSPEGLNTDILRRNRRRHNNCSNLRQRRCEDTANDPNS
jgi:hypothetical protein